MKHGASWCKPVSLLVWIGILGLVSACQTTTAQLSETELENFELKTHVLASSKGREHADKWASDRCGKKKAVFLREFKPEKTPASSVLHYEYECE